MNGPSCIPTFHKTFNSDNHEMFQLTPVGTTIFQSILAKDKDTGLNGLVEYTIIEGNGYYNDYNEEGRVNSADGYGFFAINLPHQGQVTVNRTLDYEKTQKYYVTIVATVIMLQKKLVGNGCNTRACILFQDRPRDESQRLSSTTTLTVHIKDDDDQNPTFIYKGCMLLDGVCINPEYTASVSFFLRIDCINESVFGATVIPGVPLGMALGKYQPYGLQKKIDISNPAIRNYLKLFSSSQR